MDSEDEEVFMPAGPANPRKYDNLVGFKVLKQSASPPNNQLVGEQYLETLESDVRLCWPDTWITEMYCPLRVNITINKQDVITKITWG